jgi:MFS family permease
MVDSYLVSFAGLLLTMGTLGDRFGRKRALQTGIAIFGLSSLAVLFVETSTQLIAVRALMGVGGALIMPATLSIITNVFPREERAKAIGVWAGTAAIGVGLGPLLRRPAARVLRLVLGLPHQRARRARGLRGRHAARARVARPQSGPRSTPPARCCRSARWWRSIYAVIEAPERAGWTRHPRRVRPARSLGRRVRGLGAAQPSPMLDLSLFRNPRFSIGSLSISLAFFSLFGAIFAMTQFLQFAKDYSPLEAGAAMVPLAFGLMLGATRSAKLAEQLGDHRVVAGGLWASARCWRRPCCGRATCPTGRSACGSSAWRSPWAASWGRRPLGHGRGAQGEVGRRVGHERRHPPGRRLAGDRRDRLVVASFYGSRSPIAASGLPSERRTRSRTRSAAPTRCRRSSRPTRRSGWPTARRRAFTDALGLGSAPPRSPPSWPPWSSSAACRPGPRRAPARAAVSSPCRPGVRHDRLQRRGPGSTSTACWTSTAPTRGLEVRWPPRTPRP